MSLDLNPIKARAEAATAGPWWDDSDEDCWRLHGVHARIPADPIGIPEQIINHQIIKAPKRSTPFAEYWPSEADAAFIRHAREDIPALLVEVEHLRALLGEPCPHGHYGVDKAKCGPCSFDRVAP